MDLARGGIGLDTQLISSIDSDSEPNSDDGSSSEVARILMLGFTSFTATISMILVPAIFRLRRHKVMIVLVLEQF